MTCPKCGSRDTYIYEKKRFGCGRGCLGAILFWPLILLGFTKGSKLYHVCKNCGNKFKVR